MQQLEPQSAPFSSSVPYKLLQVGAQALCLLRRGYDMVKQQLVQTMLQKIDVLQDWLIWFDYWKACRQQTCDKYIPGA